MGYCGCMGYEAVFPANQLSGLKNVWNLREYGVCEPWVTRESTVVLKSWESQSKWMQRKSTVSISVQVSITWSNIVLDPSSKPEMSEKVIKHKYS